MAYMNNDISYEPGKIFVGGLSWDTTPESMRTYFSQFGEVSDCVVMKNPGQDGKPRGFGFVTFADPLTVEKALRHGQHVLDGKTIDPKPANVKGDPRPQMNLKVFVGGLSFDTEEDALKQYFMAQGYQVASVDMKVDQQKKKRGFAFVDFVTLEDVTRACETKYFTIDSKRVEVKKAEPKNARDKSKDMAAAVMQSSNMYGLQQQYNASFPYANNEIGSRYPNVGGSPYNTTGGFPSYHQYSTAGYGDYTTAASYNQHGNSAAAVYQNYNSGYGNRSYNTPPQQLGSYGQDSATYSQSRSNGYSSAADTYSTGGGNSFSYDQSGYGYSDQSGSSSSYSGRMQTSSNSAGGQSRSTSSYQSYGTH